MSINSVGCAYCGWYAQDPMSPLMIPIVTRAVACDGTDLFHRDQSAPLMSVIRGHRVLAAVGAGDGAESEQKDAIHSLDDAEIAT